MISFAGKMTSFTYDGVTGATPLAIIKNGDKATAVADLLASGDGKTQVATSVLKMFIGTIGGTIGETSALALLLGAAYLLIKKVITWKIPCMLYWNICNICTYIWRTWF